MNPAKFTPGPWRTDSWFYDQRGTRIVIINGTDAVAEITPLYRTYPQEEEANAKLIAAAPEMFEALQDFVNGHDVLQANLVECNGGYVRHLLQDFARKASAALAKAGG